MKVLPGFEPGLVDSKSTVITNYTIGPVLLLIIIPDGIRTRNLKIRSLTPYPLGHGDISMLTCIGVTYAIIYFDKKCTRIYVRMQ